MKNLRMIFLPILILLINSILSAQQEILSERGKGSTVSSEAFFDLRSFSKAGGGEGRKKSPLSLKLERVRRV